MSEKFEQVGFPNFWDRAHAEKPEAFQAIHELIDLENRLLRNPLLSPFTG